MRRRSDGSPTDGRDAIRAITDTYGNFAIWVYSKIRFSILRQPFLEEIGQYLPREGRILDLGCGFGLFSLYFAMRDATCRIVGIDLDARRIEYATASARKLGLDNVQYHVGSALDWRSGERFHAIYMLDLIHHIPVERVDGFLAKTMELLRDDGILLVKEVADRPRYKMLFTLLLDRLMVGRGPIRYWPPEELSEKLEELGFSVVRHRMIDILPYPHVLYVARMGRVR